MVLNSWFRTGSAYTSNGICDFIRQTAALLPGQLQQVLFRADSGFFKGALFDLLESYNWSYLVKVKLKNLKGLLEKQDWHILKDQPRLAICEFEYRATGWKKARTLKAIRRIRNWVEVDYFGQKQQLPEYEYACYCSNLTGAAVLLQEQYQERSVSETWIEQIKSQLLAGRNLTAGWNWML